MADNVLIFNDGTGVVIGTITSRNDGDSSNAILTNKLLGLSHTTDTNCICVDIGAAQGWWTALATKCGYTTLSFEPDASGAALFKQNMLDNNLASKIILMECAISDKTCIQTMRTCGESSYLGKHASESNTAETFIEKQITTMRFEEIFNGTIIPFLDATIHIPLMKIDTEGHEPGVIDGMISMLEAGRIHNIITEFTAYWYGETREIAIVESEVLMRKIAAYLPYIYILSRRGSILYFGPIKASHYKHICSMLYDRHLQVDVAFLSKPIDASYGLTVIDIDKTDLRKECGLDASDKVE